MKTKFIQLTDTATEMRCLVLQFEASDAWCRAGQLDPGLKVVLQFNGRFVTCFAGYELRDDRGAKIETLSSQMSTDGTIVAFKELLHFVGDIHLLPDIVDLEPLRENSSLLRHRLFSSEELRELIDERSPESLRKVIYRSANWTHIALVDPDSKDVLYDEGTSSGDGMVAKYLWLPVSEATEAELASINLGPLRYERL